MSLSPNATGQLIGTFDGEEAVYNEHEMEALIDAMFKETFTRENPQIAYYAGKSGEDKR